MNKTRFMINDAGAWVSCQVEGPCADKVLPSGAGVVSYSSQLVAGKNSNLRNPTVGKAFNECEGSCLS